jgi:hypothetical protein
MPLIFAKEFFDIQISLAERMQTLCGVPLASALLDYTNLYIRLGFGRGFDPQHDGWRAYLAGIDNASDIREWTYQCYLREPETATTPPVVAVFGCFSYGLIDGGRVRLHFKNAEETGCSPLAFNRIEHRRAELTALFAHVKQTAGEDVRIIGGSWLYNLDAYRRLFPSAFCASASRADHRFRYMSLWGQFVNHRGKVKETVAREFLNSVAQCSDVTQLAKCFLLQVLTVEAGARNFYDFYGV